MKEEEEQAKRINQRFHKRLGLNKPQLISQPTQPSNSPKNEFNEHNTGNEQQHKRHVPFDSTDEFDQEFKMDKQQQFNKLQENAFDNFDNSQLIKPSFSSAFIANDLVSDDTNEFKMDTSKIVFSSINNNQNDLFNPVADDEVVDNHINATPPIVITKTYSITESTQTTSIVPMFVGTGLINQTITESFIIRKFITAYKTLPPGDLITLETDDPSTPPKLNETYTFSNLNLLSDLKPTSSSSNLPVLETNNPFLGKIDLNNPLIVRAALQNPKLAALYFGLQQLQQQATTYNMITKPTTSLTSSTVHHTKKISFYDGRQTRTRYLTDPGILVTSTLTVLTTEMVPVVNSQVISQQQKLQHLFANELFIQNTAMPNLLQTPLDNKPVDSLQPMASNQNNQNNNVNLENKPESSINSDLINQPIAQLPTTNQQTSLNSQPQQQSGNVLQSSFQQANNIANILQQQQSNQMAQMQAQQQSNQPNTATLPQFANLPNIAPFLNGNTNLNEVANILSNLQKGNHQKGNLQNNILSPTRIDTTTFTTQSMVTKTSTKVYTLIYNGFSTKYRTVTSTTVYPTKVTQTSTVMVTNTISPLDFNSLFG